MKGSEKRLVQAVRSDSFAGVERYLCDVTAELTRRGWAVTVIGGDPHQMTSSLPANVPHLGGRTIAEVVRRLAAVGPVPLVHAHMTAAETAAVLCRPLNHSKILATRHFAAPRGRGRLGRAAGRLIGKGVNGELAISTFVSKSTDGCPPVLLNGVPSCRNEPHDGQRHVLVMQRLQEEKDTSLAVLAFAESGLSQDGWRLKIAGRGPLEPNLRDLAHARGVSGSVDFLGFIDDPAPLRREACIFLATAPAEPFGLSIAEAMAAGLAIVATDGGAHPELLWETGLLVPVGDANACARALRRLAEDPVERRRLGALARERQRSVLSLERHVDGLEQVYGKLLA